MKTSSNNILYAVALWLVAAAAIVLAFVFFHGWQSFVAGFIGGIGIVFGFARIRS